MVAVRPSLRAGSVLLAVLALAVTTAQAGPPPVYARLGLPPDGKRVLALRLECAADPLLREVLYVDRNGDGKFTAAEKLAGQAGGYKSADFRSCRFPAIALGAWPPGKGLACRVTVSCAVLGKGPEGQAFCSAGTSFSLARDGQVWSYVSTTSLPLAGASAMSLNTAPVRGIAGPVTASLETKPHPDRRGHTGVAVHLGWPNGQLTMTSTPAPVQVQLRVVSGGGKVVVNETVPRDKLEFG